MIITAKNVPVQKIAVPAKIVNTVSIVQKMVVSVEFVNNKFEIMKKLLLLSALLIVSFVQAQDYAFIAKIKAIETQESAESLAKELADVSGKDLRFYKAKEFGDLRKLKVVFVPNTVKDEDIENHTVSDADKASFLSFVFNIDFIGENKDLEKPGVKQYRLILAESKYLTIFPIWQKYFNPTADVEKTLTDSKSRELRDYEKNIQIYIQKQGNIWTLRNDS